MHKLQADISQEYHTSARKLRANTVSFQNPQVLDTGNFFMADEDELKKIVELFNLFAASDTIPT